MLKRFQIGLLAIIALLGVILPALAQGRHEMTVNNELQGIQEVMQIIEKTNVRKLDRNTVRAFQEYTNFKDTTFKAPVQTTMKLRPAKSVNGVKAPRILEEKAF